MSDEQSAPATGAEQGTIVEISGLGDNVGAREAALALSKARATPIKPQEDQQAQPQAEAAEPEDNSAQEADSGDESPPVETQSEDAETDQSPPVDPPRSWTKEDKEVFATLPRETQERLVERERLRETDFSRRQQEATEQRKSFETKAQQVEQARAQYETALPALLQALQSQQQGDFADIRNMDDVTKLAQTDWPRYVQWDAQQKRVAAVMQEVQLASQRQVQDRQQKLSDFQQAESKLFAEKVPEIADEKVRTQLQTSAVKLLEDMGFGNDELGQLWRGEKELSLHDHRVQLLIRDGIRYRDGEKARTTVGTKLAARPVPPVQRPGVAQGRGAQTDAALTQLSNKLSQTGNVKDAARFLAQRRAAKAH